MSVNYPSISSFKSSPASRWPRRRSDGAQELHAWRESATTNRGAIGPARPAFSSLRSDTRAPPTRPVKPVRCRPSHRSQIVGCRRRRLYLSPSSPVF